MKKITLLLLTLCLCVSAVFAVTAFAEENDFTVSLSNVKENGEISGKTIIGVNAENGTLSDYDVYVDDVLAASKQTAEMFSLDTALFSNGAHDLKVVARGKSDTAETSIPVKFANLDVPDENVLLNLVGGSDIYGSFLSGEAYVENNGETAKFTEVGANSWGGATSTSFNVNFTRNPVLEINVASLTEGAKYDLQITFIGGAGEGVDINKYLKDQLTFTGVYTLDITAALHNMAWANSAGMSEERLEEIITADQEWEIAVFFFLRDLDGAEAEVRSVRVYYPSEGNPVDRVYTQKDLVSFAAAEGKGNTAALQNGFVHFEVGTDGQYDNFMPAEDLTVDFSASEIYVEFEIANINAQWGLRYSIDGGGTQWWIHNKGAGTDGKYVVQLKANQVYREKNCWIGFANMDNGFAGLSGIHKLKIGFDLQNDGTINSGNYGYDVRNLKVYHVYAPSVATYSAAEGKGKTEVKGDNYVHFEVGIDGQYDNFMPEQALTINFDTTAEIFVVFEVANINAQWGLRYSIDGGGTQWWINNKGAGTDGKYVVQLKQNQSYRNNGLWNGFNGAAQFAELHGEHEVRIGFDLQNDGTINSGSYGYDIRNFSVYYGEEHAFNAVKAISTESFAFNAEDIGALDAVSASVETANGAAKITKASDVTLGGVITGEYYVDFARTPKLEFTATEVSYAYDIYVYVDGGTRGYSLLNNSSETGEREVWILTGITNNEPKFDKISPETDPVHSMRFAIYANGETGEETYVSVSSFALVYDEVEPEPVIAVERVLVTAQKSTVAVGEVVTLTANIVPSEAAVETVNWYVNGEKTSATGTVYEFSATEAGTYSVVAEVNGVQSDARKIVVKAEDTGSENSGKTSESPSESGSSCGGALGVSAFMGGLLLIGFALLKKKNEK